MRIRCGSDADQMRIRCGSDADQMRIRCESDANQMRISNIGEINRGLDFGLNIDIGYYTIFNEINKLISHFLMKRYNKHIFICENERPPDHPKGCCKLKGGSEVKELFKKRLRELGLSPLMRANTSGCLDACEYGVTVLVYPEQIWYGGVKKEDVEEIIQEHLINNKHVERLKIKDPKFNKDVT